ncbi:hypothetical protein ZHAS_00022065 [Anopheles sinensis]|uniref:Uncharacterized protein n=1 Tax=Anopheles sinensis TaxID=74873 RepID=A0A084WTZ7_ANOSI|nr:hypothetical protein ZHAS_00022065 [Anopheles sinensis]
MPTASMPSPCADVGKGSGKKEANGGGVGGGRKECAECICTGWVESCWKDGASPEWLV